MKKILIALFAFSLVSSANAADLYKVDPTHASINWTANHYGFSNQSGKISDVSGSLILDDANPQNSSIEVQIGVASLVTGMAKFDEHLKSADFLNVVKFPTATFKSTSVAPSGKSFAKVKGDFTLLGVTKNITLDVKLVRIGLNPINQKKTAGFYATTTIRRSDFGITFGAPGVSDLVKIVIDLEANFISGDNTQVKGAGPILGYKSSKPAASSIPEWKIIPNKSTLTFKTTHDKSPIEGSFKKFDGKIIFDKNQLSKSSITINVDTTSVDISYAEALSTLSSAAWLSTKAFPNATFTSNNIVSLSDVNLTKLTDVNTNKNVANANLNNMNNVKTDDNSDVNLKNLKNPLSFRANGNLNLKGKSVPASIEFVLNNYSQTEASATGKLKIKRSAFGIGDRDVKKANGVADDIEINFTVSAER